MKILQKYDYSIYFYILDTILKITLINLDLEDKKKYKKYLMGHHSEYLLVTSSISKIPFMLYV